MDRSSVKFLTVVITITLLCRFFTTISAFPEENRIRIKAEEMDDKCLEGEYEHWANNMCLPCLEHNAVCIKSRQCCSDSNMACWQYGHNQPLCKCDPGYLWDDEQHKCQSTNVPQDTATWVIIGITSAVVAAAVISTVIFISLTCKRK